MKRKLFPKRKNFEQINDDLGFDYQVVEEKQYWIEDVGYEFTDTEVDKIEIATNELQQMCFAAIDHVIQNNKFHLFNIPPEYIPYIKKSWEREDWSLYGRFDFFFDGNNIKMYEYNADTPTSLLEASLAQWEWKEGQKLPDQFNSINEKMIAWWTSFQEEKNEDNETVYFTTIKDNTEDMRNTEYIMDTAAQAGLNVDFLFIEDIGQDGEYLYDLKGKQIKFLFKLYPWEWLANEEISKTLLCDNTVIIEPVWKMLLSNKALLAVLWDLYKDHEYLLPTYFSPEKLGSDYVKKPLLSREGQNVEIISSDESKSEKKNGLYRSEKNIYQAMCVLPQIDNYYPVIGSWVIGEESAGMGIREDESKITANLSRFVPHYFVKAVSKKVLNTNHSNTQKNEYNKSKKDEKVSKRQRNKFLIEVMKIAVVFITFSVIFFSVRSYNKKVDAENNIQQNFLKTVLNETKFNESKQWIKDNVDVQNQKVFTTFLENHRKLVTDGVIDENHFLSIDRDMTYAPYCIIGSKDLDKFNTFVSEHLSESLKQDEFLVALKKKYKYKTHKIEVPKEEEINQFCEFKDLEKDLIQLNKESPSSKIIIEKDTKEEE